MFSNYHIGVESKLPEGEEQIVLTNPDLELIYPIPIFTDLFGLYGPAGVDYIPRVSDPYHPAKTIEHRKHLGADLSYKRLKRGKQKLPEFTKLFFNPSDIIPIIAMFDGFVHTARKGKRNHFVLLDHGDRLGEPLTTFYQHLASLAVPFIRKGKTKDGKRFFVKKGQILGIMGHNPAGYRFNHLHFSVRNPVNSIDPAPFLARAKMLRMNDPRITVPTGETVREIIQRPGIPLNVRNQSVIPAVIFFTSLAAYAYWRDTQ